MGFATSHFANWHRRSGPPAPGYGWWVILRTGMPLTTVSGYIRRFEDRGHIARAANPDDGRSQLLTLTPVCRDWFLDAVKIFSKTISHLDATMEADGVDSADLIDQLDRVQGLIARTLVALGDPD